MNRGSGTPYVGMARRNTSFNEAPIHESGKCHHPLLADRNSLVCFNEAPIHESGK